MKQADLDACHRLLRRCRSLISVKTALVLSPEGDSEHGVIAAALGSTVAVGSSTIVTWNLSNPEPSGGHWDLIKCCNCFMASPDPAAWIKHVASVSRWFLLQDLVRAWRGITETDPDTGDITRYCFTSRGELSRPGVATFDLSMFDDAIVDIEFFYDEPGEGDPRDCRKFAVVWDCEKLLEILAPPVGE